VPKGRGGDSDRPQGPGRRLIYSLSKEGTPRLMFIVQTLLFCLAKSPGVADPNAFYADPVQALLCAYQIVQDL
jgi:hypothetical protein